MLQLTSSTENQSAMTVQELEKIVNLLLLIAVCLALGIATFRISPWLEKKPLIVAFAWFIGVVSILLFVAYMFFENTPPSATPTITPDALGAEATPRGN